MKKFGQIVECNILLKKTPKETFSTIIDAYGEGSISLRSIQMDYRRFEAGEDIIHHRPRSGRPGVEIDEELVELVVKCPYLAAEKMGEYLNCSRSTVTRRLKALGYSYKLDIWLPYQLKEEHFQRRAALAEKLLKCATQLAKVWKRVMELRPPMTFKWRPVLLHDNARPHTAKSTRQAMEELRIPVLEHPAYSHRFSSIQTLTTVFQGQ
ncbi:histone-lysine N-methyltransferase SETMAR-like protein [Lates japonicus]|uniref:Histone-lysine N-methyltransferase SETMAR-like protein n=1 Tax=Lates japonicus TaxID=270547 RepID=A0AAD3N0M4_LATJO|nr:histone-lysine N-methyltransferase SETMAR-like protein [Lates japonicus]